MVLTKIITKKLLEKIISQVFLNFGNIKTSQLLDSLKAFGFFYATSSGLSISLEDLKSSEKNNIINEYSENYISEINIKWLKGLISNTERFQNLLNHWTINTEIIKNEIIKYYKLYDPVNSLYMMAFSGARGNISQVKQIVGIRGLMSDQFGNIITLPIKSNFKEGLSSVDYLISSYGARKGIVDTALKTASAGYLTRRLIFLAQNVIIRIIDCNTTKNIFIDLSKNLFSENLEGRYCKLILVKNNSNFYFLPKFTNSFLNKKDCNFLKNKNFYLKIQSPLTCKNESSLCQKCYGWDLSKFNKISLGQAVGIISAQSIGEPGTQLTMRTFHTGGIFSGNIDENFLPFPVSGKIIYYKNFFGSYQKSIFGENILKLTQNLEIKIFNWKTGLKFFSIPKGMEFYLYKNFFIKKGEKIANLKSSYFLKKNDIEKLIPIYLPISGEVIKKKIYYKEISNGVNLILKNSNFSIALGKIFSFHCKIKYRQLTNFNFKKPLAYLNILITPNSGLLIKEEDIFILYSKYKKFFFDFQNNFKIKKLFLLNKSESNLKKELIIFPEIYQFIDKKSFCARIEIFPKISEKLFKIFYKKEYKIFKKNLFCLREFDIYSIYNDQISNLYSNLKIGKIYNFNKNLTSTLNLPLKGKLIYKDGLLYIFQKIQSFNISKGSIFYKKINKKFFYQNELLCHSIIYKKQTSDIVQGLPKIDQLIEAKCPFKYSGLISNPGIFFDKKSKNIILKNKIKFNNILYYKLLFQNTKYQKNNIIIFQTGKKKINYQNFCLKFIFNYYKKFSLNKLILTKNYYNNYIIKEKINYIFKKISPFFIIKTNSINLKFKFFSFLQLGYRIKGNILNPHLLLFSFFNYYQKRKKCKLYSCLLSFQKLQLILSNSIQSVYYHQGVKISNKHIELIIRQLTSKIFLIEYNNKKFLQKDFIYISILKNYKKSINKLIEKFENKLIFNNKNIKNLEKKELLNLLNKKINLKENEESFQFLPIYLGCTLNSLSRNSGFLTTASFQDTKRILMRAALFSSIDWLRTLKDSIIVGKLIFAGSTYLYNKNYLDTIYYYNNKNDK